jgi:Na+/melibiose symporter-like transporter
VKLTFLQQFGLGFLSLPISLIVISVLTFLPTYYALDLGVGLTATGLIFAVGRILDVVTDPLIGHASDATSSPAGKRLPWMLVGAVILCPTLYGVMTPSADISVTLLALMVGLFFLAVTLLDLPYSAVGLEISPFVHERTIIAAIKAVFQIIGALGAPLIILRFAENLSYGLRATAMTAIALILCGLVAFVILTPFKNRQQHSFTRKTQLHLSPANGLRRLFRDKAYSRLLAAFGFAQAGSAMTVALTALLLAKHYGTPELTGLFIAIVLLSSAAGLPLWVYAARRLGKKRSWQLGLLCGVVLMVAAALFLHGPLWLFGVFCCLFGLIVAGDVILPTTMLADIVSDETNGADHSLAGRNQAGAMLGFKNAVSKLGFVGPMLFAFPVLGLLNVETAETLSPMQYWVLISFYAFIPAGLRLIAIRIFSGSFRCPTQARASI